MEPGELAEFIRERSQKGELVAQADIEAELGVLPELTSDPAAEPVPIPTFIHQTMLSYPDLKMIPDGSGGAWYFSDQSMTGAYAQILLLKGRGPLGMMAEVIREHSRVYPRPVPLTLFRCAPFNLSDDEIGLCLEQMTGNSLYRDVTRLTTSIGNVFVYSTDHLDPGYAAMLAEWADVGQAENP